MNKYIIFDFDGTIADSMNLMLQVGNELADKYGIKRVTCDEFVALNGLPIRQRCKLLGIPWSKLPVYAIELINNCRERIMSLNSFEGMRELIVKLKNDFELAIITSNSVENVKKFLDKNDLGFFSEIQSNNGLLGKNMAIRKFLKNKKADRQDVIYIGDELRDIISCKKAGVKIISVTWGYDSYDLLVNGEPDYIVAKPDEILDIVYKL